MGKGGMEIDSFNKDGEVKGSPHVLFIHTHTSAELAKNPVETPVV